MKNRIYFLFCIAFIFFGLSNAAAQEPPPVREPDYNKPLLFKNFPDQIEVSVGTLEPLLQTASTKVSQNPPAVTEIFLKFNEAFQCKGIVSSYISKSNGNIKSVAIRLTNFPGAGFSLSKVTKENGEVLYTGEIVSMQSGDAYIIIKKNNKYYLEKKNFYDVLSD